MPALVRPGHDVTGISARSPSGPVAPAGRGGYPHSRSLRPSAMGLVFMVAFVLPVYLVPALTVILAPGLAVETRPGWRSALSTPRQPARYFLAMTASRRPTPGWSHQIMSGQQVCD